MPNAKYPNGTRITIINIIGFMPKIFSNLLENKEDSATVKLSKTQIVVVCISEKS